MTPPADQHPGRLSRSPRLAGAVRDELAKLRGRILGDCAACGHPVYVEHNFTRLNGRVVHVRCPITTPQPTTSASRARDRRTTAAR